MSYKDWCTMRENMPVKRTHQIFILLCLHFTIVHSYFERVCDSRTEQRGPDPEGICGGMIPEMLHLVCDGEYYVPSHAKRDVSSRSHKQENNVDFPRYSPLEGLILGKREASMYLSSEHSRTKRNTYTGIVCECCYHSCDYFELLQYCAVRKKRDTKPDSISANSHNSGIMVDKLSK
ncbi:con-Ins Im2-like [Saccostrea echinata]|uniref:con-Ins Im2-like n=1 Tax=Saccostrea echinata TaxID=191078 RepID=UPI002A7F111E|nr:con-Ins Im2-like [Saccostrea echinata]